MVKREIRWNIRAIQDKLEIYDYWNKRNGSIFYSIKLEKLFNETVKTVSIFPNAGFKTEIDNIRILFVRNFKVVFKIASGSIEILRVWDSNRNPKDFKY